MKKLFLILILFLKFSYDVYAFEIPDQIQGISIPKPTAEITKFDIDSISLHDITFLFDVAITNPYPVKLKLSTLKAAFIVENKQFFKTATDKLKIKAKGTEITRLLVNIKYADMANIVKDYSNKDSLECLIDIVIVLPLPESVQSISKDITFKFNLKKNVPTIRPEINIVNFNVIKPTKEEIDAALRRSAKKNLNADSVKKMFEAMIDGKDTAKIIDPSELDLKLKVNFDILMKNKTKAALYFNDLNYNFNINASKLIDGYTKNIQNKQGEYILRVNNDFSSKNLGKAILNAFKHGKGDYLLTGFSMVKLPDKIKKEALKLNFNEKGILNIK
jgi:LEA14-like dessication related protein